MKILCAAAAEKWSFERCLVLGQALNAQTVSIGSALDHCHVPGRQHQAVADDICVVGAGIHNEPGQQMISPFPSVEELIKRCLGLLCDQSDYERAFVSLDKNDEVMLLINNYGGLSPLELGALTDEVQQQLESNYGIKPCRTLSGVFETSLNAPGFSISLCNISAAARQCQSNPAELVQLFDRPTTAVSWPNLDRPTGEMTQPTTSGVPSQSATAKQSLSDTESIMVDSKLLESAVRSACEGAIAAEPQLTKWDMVMGDGDCGEAVKGLCESIIRELGKGVATKGSVLAFLSAITDFVDDMGGTLGAIFGILLSAFFTALRSNARKSLSTPQLYATSLASAVESLKLHTAAREGDRTVMDVLIPFTDVFVHSGDFGASVRVAAEKAEATRLLKARMGRASYVGEASGQELPDPGAWTLYEILAGLAKGLSIPVPI